MHHFRFLQLVIKIRVQCTYRTIGVNIVKVYDLQVEVMAVHVVSINHCLLSIEQFRSMVYQHNANAFYRR